MVVQRFDELERAEIERRFRGAEIVRLGIAEELVAVAKAGFDRGECRAGPRIVAAQEVKFYELQKARVQLASTKACNEKAKRFVPRFDFNSHADMCGAIMLESGALAQPEHITDISRSIAGRPTQEGGIGVDPLACPIFPEPGIGLVEFLPGALADVLEGLKVIGLSHPQKAVIKKRLLEGQNDLSVNVILALFVSLIAKPDRAHAAIADEAGGSFLVEFLFEADAKHGLFVAASGLIDKIAEIAQIVLEYASGVETIEGVHDIVGVANPAVAIIPVALRLAASGIDVVIAGILPNDAIRWWIRCVRKVLPRLPGDRACRGDHCVIRPWAAAGRDIMTEDEFATGPSGHPVEGSKPRGEGFGALLFGSIGVVFGDIGTSPLYAMREALAHSQSHGRAELAVLGVVSLAFWSLLLVVSLKYVYFLMKADNRGEGGTLALMALAQRALGRRSRIVMVLGVCGAALFYGDGIVTPAVSVMGAVEGLGEAPGLGAALKPFVLPIALVILIGLFMVQSRGTATISKLFSPIVLCWFLALAALGVLHIADDPSILRALSPHYAVLFLISNGALSFLILGSIFLAVTGAEALYADMGHFGKGPIRAAWIYLVFPCLMLNYLGQGGLVLSDPSAAENPFFRMIPEAVYWPVLLLGTAAAAIASQAVITGAFSLTQQAVQLGLLPRLRILRTSETQSGQIYVPQVNTFLLIGVIALLLFLQTSSNLAAAYGIAVTGAMFIDTLLFFVIIRWLWKRPWWQAILAVTVFGSLDIVFLGSNLLKIPQGAWIPLVLGFSLVVIMLVWAQGVAVLTERTSRESIPLTDLLAALKTKPPHRIDGTAIFLTADPLTAPSALMHNLKHNRVLHARNIILSIQTATTPRVAPEDRAVMEQIDEDFTRLTLSYGFMETPNVPQALARCRKAGSLKFDIMSTSFFLSRRTLKASPHVGLPLWQDHIFIFLMKNAGNPTDFFQLPANRVVEMGAQVVV